MIRYYKEDISFNLSEKRKFNRWLLDVCHNEGRVRGDINYIFCSDAYLLDINRKYLGHDYYTDIITFDYCEGNVISGDLFISIDSVKENASYYKVDFMTELSRVMVHGVLHLIGYNDHSSSEKKIMRSKEDFYIERFL